MPDFAGFPWHDQNRTPGTASTTVAVCPRCRKPVGSMHFDFMERITRYLPCGCQNPPTSVLEDR